MFIVFKFACVKGLTEGSVYIYYMPYHMYVCHQMYPQIGNAIHGHSTSPQWFDKCPS
jgi:hypothetical protein